MIIKKRSVDYKYLGLQMLFKRLPDEHAMKSVINSKLLSAKAGITGEKIVEEVFCKYSFPFNYCVLHDVNLSLNGKFQIDTLFICQYYVLILECKNIVGDLSFENDPACLKREIGNIQKDTFESPEVQVDRNAYLLKEWLCKQSVDIPIFRVIVLSSTRSVVVKPPNHIPVIYAASIPVFIRKLQREKEYLTVTQMKLITDKIVKDHQSYIPFPMCKQWGIDSNDLITGVKCKVCDKYGMEKLKKGWYCTSCGNVDRQAHEDAIKDWFCLIRNTLTNRECREFLHINSYQTSLRVIEAMNLIKQGHSNKTVYFWSWVENKQSDGKSKLSDGYHQESGGSE